jgi:succinate dehydrogenase / fumarate reductase, membrane anchor subunit
MLRSRTVPRRDLSLDFVMWIFTRISGAALLILGAMGMIGALIMGARLQMDLPTLMRWTFFPNASHVVNSNIPDVNLGWVSGYWRVMQILIVFFGITHGFNGLRVVMEDYIGKEPIRRLLRWVILALWIVVMVVAVYVIFTT